MYHILLKDMDLKLATNSSTFVLIVTSILNDAGHKLSSQRIDYLLALTPARISTAPNPALYAYLQPTLDTYVNKHGSQTKGV